MSDSATPWTAACQAPLSTTISWSLLKLMSIKWCHPTISSSVIPFSSCPQSVPASGSFPVSQFYTAGGQSSGASASASLLSMNIQSWFPLRLTGLISLLSKGLSCLLQHHNSKTSIVRRSAFFMVQFSYLYVTAGKTIALSMWTFVGRVMSLLFNMLSRLAIAFLPRSKRLLISWLQSPPAIILEPKKTNSVTASTFPPSISHEVGDQMPWSSFFECWVLSQLFHSPLSRPPLRPALHQTS